MGLVSDGEEGVIVFRRPRIWLFFQGVAEDAEEKESLISAVRWVRITGVQSLSIATEMLSGPERLE